MTLVLASGSASRRAMLEAAGVDFEARPVEVDEGAIRRELVGVPPAQVALILAEAKALAGSAASPARLVLGSDSLVEVCGRIFGKPGTRDKAEEHLRCFSGQTMRLHSAAVLTRDGGAVWRHRGPKLGEHNAEVFAATGVTGPLPDLSPDKIGTAYDKE